MFTDVCVCAQFEFTDDAAKIHYSLCLHAGYICHLFVAACAGHASTYMCVSWACVYEPTVMIHCPDFLPPAPLQSSTSEYKLCSSVSLRHGVSPFEHFCCLAASSSSSHLLWSASCQLETLQNLDFCCWINTFVKCINSLFCRAWV